ncbi:MAG: hypothetical protein ACRCX2_25790 [Paraclostridium sp.]|uniref:hypothetical protein n=1 Tax=Cetobacterium sp. TaxID=2071632 RepID=UPI003F39F85A
MKKQFISYNDVVELKGFSTLEDKGLVKKGPGSVLLFKKGSTMEKIPYANLNTFKEWLASKTAPAPVEITIPNEWATIWYALPTVDSIEGKGNSLKKFSLKVWCDLLVRDNVSLAQAIYVLENRENKALLTQCFKSPKCKLSETWKKRFLK